jgi:hypothetical protein
MIQIPCTAPGSYPHVQQQHPFQLLSPTSLVSNFSDPAIVPQGTPPVIISSVHSSDYSFNMRNYPPLLPRSTQGVFHGDADAISISGSTINSAPFQDGGFIPSATDSQISASHYAYQTPAHVSSVGAHYHNMMISPHPSVHVPEHSNYASFHSTGSHRSVHPSHPSMPSLHSMPSLSPAHTSVFAHDSGIPMHPLQYFYPSVIAPEDKKEKFKLSAYDPSKISW